MGYVLNLTVSYIYESTEQTISDVSRMNYFKIWDRSGRSEASIVKRRVSKVVTI